MEAYDLGNGYGHSIAISTDDLEGLHEKRIKRLATVTDLKGLPGTAPSYCTFVGRWFIKSKSFVNVKEFHLFTY